MATLCALPLLHRGQTSALVSPPDPSTSVSLESCGSLEAATLLPRVPLPPLPAGLNFGLLMCGVRLEESSPIAVAPLTGEGRPDFGDKVGVGGGTIA